MIINPDNGTNPQTVYLVNNGLTSATSLTITPVYPITVSSNTCGTSLNAGASCSFVINVSGSPVSGQSSVAISYFNSQSAQVLYFNVSYLDQVSPALTLTSSGNFSNIAVNTVPVYTSVNVTNSGNISLSNVQFSNVNLQESNMFSFATGSSCYNGITLNTGQSCLMVLAYQPLVVKSSSINFIPTASYVGGGGESRTYANSILNIAYSAVTFATFVAMGDYGTTISSTNNPPSTWTVNLASPFGGSNDILGGFVANNGVYVFLLYGGPNMESSTQNALFWRISLANELYTCNITYDGTAYYTCFQESVAFGGACTTAVNSGCIIKSTDLVTWSGIYEESGGVFGVFSSINYYTNGTNKAYIATTGINTTNSGLAVSPDGNIFSVPNSGMSVANSTLLSSAFNPTANTITAWASTGFSTTANITAITSPWAPNTTTGPATPVNAAIFQNGIYTLAAGNSGAPSGIYTATSSTGTYTQVYNSGTGNVMSSLAYGNGIYVASGTTGILAESVNAWAAITNPYNASLKVAYFESAANRFWIGGKNVIAYSPATATLTWQKPTLNHTVKNGTTYLTVDKMGGIFSSTSLSSWTTRTNPTGKQLYHLACPNTNLCFAVGESGVILKSTDSATWVQQTSPVPTTITLRDIECNLNVCVAVGGSGSANSGTVVTTTDFSTWTLRTTSLATTSFMTAAYYSAANLLIASGLGGVTYTSTNNGLSWQLVSLGTAQNIYSLTCSNNPGCVGVGESGAIVFSNNGISWSVQTSGTTQPLRSVAYNGTFVTVGESGTLLYSTSGTSWSKGTFPTSMPSSTSMATVFSN